MVTMIITLSITLALALVFVFIVLPKQKFRSVDKAYRYILSSAKTARALTGEPSPEGVKKLQKMLNKCASLLSYAVYEGLGELKAAEDALAPVCEIAKNLVIVKADSTKIKKFAAIMLPMLAAVKNKMLPFANIYKSGEKFTLSARAKAEAHLASVAGDKTADDDSQE